METKENQLQLTHSGNTTNHLLNVAKVVIKKDEHTSAMGWETGRGKGGQKEGKAFHCYAW